eukprot:Blabericola_migrator_1__12934@NODE_852_length_6254_cov_97_311460_g603_i0_p4_GENE_NODE_852_length_6254_cov_97_311460_g603_i0NODE_852_length_6254_cov_97_311460_g603_i0_p4_ORF_typecomplete_len107_score10_39_NODE_852_length_6254_cov_97_311460_g603_i039974317
MELRLPTLPRLLRIYFEASVYNPDHGPAECLPVLLDLDLEAIDDFRISEFVEFRFLHPTEPRVARHFLDRRYATRIASNQRHLALAHSDVAGTDRASQALSGFWRF